MLKAIIPTMVILILVLAGFLYIMRQIRHFMQHLSLAMSASSVPPFELEIIPEFDIEWNDSGQLNSLSKELENLHYQAVGDFEISNMPTELNVRGFHHSEKGFFAVIYDSPSREPFVEIHVTLDDGSEIESSSGVDNGMKIPSFCCRKYFKLNLREDPASLSDLHQFMIKKTADKTIQRQQPNSFSEFLCRSYKRTMDWHIERGGISREEIVQATEIPPSEEKIGQILKDWQTAIAESNQKAFLRESGWTLAKWQENEDRIFFLNDHCDRESIIAAFIHLSSESSFEDKETLKATKRKWHRECQDLSPQEVFNLLQHSLPKDCRYERILTLTAPCSSHVYLAPVQKKGAAFATPINKQYC